MSADTDHFYCVNTFYKVLISKMQFPSRKLLAGDLIGKITKIKSKYKYYILYMKMTQQ